MEKCTCKLSGLVVAGLSVMIGLMVLGNCVGNGIKHFADKDRFVTVKGLAEREVMANRVVWPLPFNCVGNNLEELYNSVERNKNTILTFLNENGIAQDEIILSAPTVTDREAQSYAPDNIKYRYQVEMVVTIISVDEQTSRPDEAGHSHRCRLPLSNAIRVYASERFEAGDD